MKRGLEDEKEKTSSKKKKGTHISFAPKKNFNKHITEILVKLAEIEKNRGEVYKAKAYRKSVASLEHLDYPIQSGEDAKLLDGVGEKIAKKIDEIIESGKLNKLVSELSDPKVVAVNELSRITGIGPSFAQKLVNEQGIMSIEDLKTKKVKLNHHQEIGLKYFQEFEQRIPRGEIEIYERLVRKSLDEIDGNIEMIIAGSYRRGAPTSGDVDILITQEKTSSICLDDYTLLDRVIKKLQKDKIITDVIGHGGKKFMGVAKLPDDINEYKPHIHRRIDVMFICHDQYYCGLLHFTGSDFFNNQLRSHAIEKGFHLSEFAITKKPSASPLKVTCEKDIFDYLEVDYLEPSQRSL